jgi:hypothetical protein
MIIQLDPPIPLVTPKGKGWAHLVIDYSQEHDLLWVVFIDDDGTCWTFNNRVVTIQNNVTMGRQNAKSTQSV